MSKRFLSRTKLNVGNSIVGIVERSTLYQAIHFERESKFLRFLRYQSGGTEQQKLRIRTHQAS